jgi:hypothetical protein
MAVQVGRKLRRLIDAPATRSILKCVAVCALGRVSGGGRMRGRNEKSCCG